MFFLINDMRIVNKTENSKAYRYIKGNLLFFKLTSWKTSFEKVVFEAQRIKSFRLRMTILQDDLKCRLDSTCIPFAIWIGRSKVGSKYFFFLGKKKKYLETLTSKSHPSSLFIIVMNEH